MSARRSLIVVLAFTAAVVPSVVARAETRPVSAGNYYYEDDKTHDRAKIVVQQGDQLAVTVREGIYPPHTVEVDELNIHSGDILLGETYTTPPLNRPGNFLMYCRPHRERGHTTTLIIQATAAKKPAPSPAPTSGATAAPAGAVAATPTTAPTATASLAPVGVRKATAEELERPVAIDPDSVEGLTGRRLSPAPWTRALWLLLIATVPVVAAAVFALRRELARSAVPTGSSPSSADRRRSSARSPRSSARKASASERRSRGRRR